MMAIPQVLYFLKDAYGMVIVTEVTGIGGPNIGPFKKRYSR